MATCKGCGAEIIWARTKNDKLMPVNARVTKVAVLGRASFSNEPVVDELVDGHEPHHGTCPKASEFRRKKDAAGTATTDR